ncbi:MAG: hypothetical protein K8R49_08650 [Candidatus Cloacimonetes bacterium]|nr:hypothetical protein [Candidatus Cloacimonadota bacterium]
MIEKYNPTEYLIKLQKIKYRALIFPIGVIIISFGVYYIFRINFMKYFSIAGLIVYFFIIMLFHVKKTIPPQTENNVVLAPIFGKISEIKDRKVKIKKSLFQPADIRCAESGKEINITSSRIYWFEKKAALQGKLIGVIPANAECICEIPDEFDIEVKIGQKVEAGETIIGSKTRKI